MQFIAVDNGSGDGSAELMSQWCEAHDQVLPLISERNLGFAGGMNWAAEHATGEWLLLVNSDTVMPDLSLEALKRVLADASDSVGMIGPVTNAAGNGQRLWRPDAGMQEWLAIGRALHEEPSGVLLNAYRCDFFCIAVRRKVWLELRGLDTAFGLGYYEDFDFSLRVREAGYQQAITEDVFVFHAGSASFGGSPQARELIRSNKRLLKRKHRNVIFQHTRDANLSILQDYEGLRRRGIWTPALEFRRQLRIGALAGDAPRSPIKRWLWNRRVKKVLNG